MKTIQAKCVADLCLVLVVNIKANQQVTIPCHGQRIEQIPDCGRPFIGINLLELAGHLIRNRHNLLVIQCMRFTVAFSARIQGNPHGDSAQIPGEPLGLVEIGATKFLESDAKRLLQEVTCSLAITALSYQEKTETAAVPFDQFRLGGPVPIANCRHEASSDPRLFD